MQAADSETEAFREEKLREKNVQAEESLKGEYMAADTNGAGVLYMILQCAAVLWAVGMITLFVWQAVCYRRFCGNLEKTKSYLTQKDSLFAYTSSSIGAPMLVGIRKPQILLHDREYSKEQLQIEAFALKEKLSMLSGSVAEDLAGVSFGYSSLKTGSFVGKEYMYEDEDGWRYYLEEDKVQESALWETASAIGPLLLTRYREEERQILEDLIYEGTWRECPVLFSEGRIIYKAAPTPDIIGIKDPVLVSIAMDGSDRRTADTILYHTSDGLCEDNGWLYYTGWTNDNEFPKPLCRIRPDFTGGPQYVEDIPGLLCGVMDGHVFYMAAKEKKPGIWKRDLSTGKELIHDKWGESAEEFCYFYAREKTYRAGELREEEISGCEILYAYGYDEEFYVSNVPFYIEN